MIKKIVFLTITIFAIYISANIIFRPNVLELKNCMVAKMNKVELCKKSPQYVQFSKLPEHLIQALVVSEDAGFYGHEGFDWHEIKKSMEQNIAKGYFFRGGSTLSQQLVKNVFLSKEKSIRRKLIEAVLTYELEKNFTKKQILEKYFNVVEFGIDVYGIHSASNKYFYKSPEDLTLIESVFLVQGLPNPKKYYSGYDNGEYNEVTLKKMKIILERLLFYKKIDQFAFESAMIDLNLDYHDSSEF